MSFFNDTNKKRVEKICEIIELIKKSGRSNEADSNQYQEILRPVSSMLEEIVPQITSASGEENTIEPISEAPEGSGARGRVPSHILIRQAAEEAPFEDLIYAMAVFMNRFDDAMKSDLEEWRELHQDDQPLLADGYTGVAMHRPGVWLVKGPGPNKEGLENG